MADLRAGKLIAGVCLTHTFDAFVALRLLMRVSLWIIACRR